MEVLIVILLCVVVFVAQISLAGALVMVERRFVSFMQTRVGPNRAGPLGLLQILADGLKLFTKESIVPVRVDRIVYELAPLLAVLPAFLAFVVIPFGPGFHLTYGGETHFVRMQLADINVGLMWVLAMSSVGVYSAMLAGWSSKSKYPLLGGVRASAQVISYEAALSLSILPVVLAAGTLDPFKIVKMQESSVWYFIPLIVPFVVFYIAGLAETNRPPFDLTEAESELVAGFHTEYSGVRFVLFFLAEYVNLITICALATTFFLGGWLGPIPFGSIAGVNIVPLWGVVWFFVKTMLLILVAIWVRASIPRLRYDQLMSFGWKLLLPLNIAYLMAVAAWVAAAETGALPQIFGR